ncbi:MAG: hypothetical protein MJD61_21225 [Proteobacteria bacterium]|nr:hypothetical protein [Pseudomonadota bacterium]
MRGLKQSGGSLSEAMRARSRVIPCLALIVTVVACGGSGEPACVAQLPRASQGECNLQYMPTFDRIYLETLGSGSCGTVEGLMCHSPNASAGGLILAADENTAFRSLLQGGRVIPFDPECSPLMRRLESGKADFQMPPGGQLSPQVRCAIVEWIANGAPR